MRNGLPLRLKSGERIILLAAGWLLGLADGLENGAIAQPTSSVPAEAASAKITVGLYHQPPFAIKTEA